MVVPSICFHAFRAPYLHDKLGACETGITITSVLDPVAWKLTMDAYIKMHLRELSKTLQ